MTYHDSLPIVTKFDFTVRTTSEYDPDFMWERVVSRVFIGDQDTGVYSAGAMFFGFPLSAAARETERSVIDEFVGTGYRKQVTALSREVRDLQARVDHLTRPRWWQFNRLRLWVAERTA